MVKISFIVPVYNQQRYVKQCLDSITNQGLQEDKYEIIIVNDGSSDNSLAIIQQFAQSRSNVIVIDKKNGGIEKARHDGYMSANGKYIAHVDSDDFLEPNIYARMLKIAEDTDADYVECASNRYIGNRLIHYKTRRGQEVTGLIEQPELFNDYYISFFGVNRLSINVWGKLYRKSTIDKSQLKPSGYTMGEDLIYNLKLFPFLNKIYILDDVGYNYRWGGMTSKFNPKFYSDIRRMYNFKLQQALEYNYTKAITPLKIELKNALLFEIIQRIKWGTEPAEATISFITEDLESPEWKEIIETMATSEYFQNEFCQSLICGDVEKAYRCCKDTIKKNRINTGIRYFAAKVISKIL